jgi:MFS transporter, FSR family, fosmidomycin resistance protein
VVFQITASLLQPIVGLYTDRKPQPYSLPIGMAISISGLFTLAFATQYALLLLGGALLGVGSSIFHPETSRIARLASGGSHGMAQSIFQVGGNFGSSLGPLLMIFLVLPNGQHGLAWFSIAALLGIAMLTGLARRYKQHGHEIHKKQVAVKIGTLSRKQVVGAIAVLILLTFSKYFYLVSITSYYIFYLMQHFPVVQRQSQLYLFLFLAALAVGTVAGGLWATESAARN